MTIKNPVKKTLKHLWVIFAFCILFPGQCNAEQTITIVRGQEFPPYHYMGSNGKIEGFVVEIIQETARLTGIRVKFEQFPWSRCLKRVKSGQADAMMNLFKTKKRENFLCFEENILSYETNTFFVLSTSKITFDGQFASIAPYKIGTIRNYSYGPDFDKFIFPGKYQLETEQELINSLNNLRGQVILGNKVTVQKLIDKMGLGNAFKALSPDVSSEPLYLGFSKVRGHEKLAKRFSDHLKEFKTTAAYTNILEKYLSAPE